MVEFKQEVFTERLKEVLKERRMTQKELSKLLNITESSVTRYVNGERFPNMETLYKLSLMLEIPSDYFLGLIDKY